MKIRRFIQMIGGVNRWVMDGASIVHTDTSERGLKRLICTALTGVSCDRGPAPADTAEELPSTHRAGWSCGEPHDYDREYCVELLQFSTFLRVTQPEAAETLALHEDGHTRRKFLARLQGEISKRGTIDVLRHGIRHGALDPDLVNNAPSADNEKTGKRFELNRFTVTPQLR